MAILSLLLPLLDQSTPVLPVSSLPLLLLLHLPLCLLQNLKRSFAVVAVVLFVLNYFRFEVGASYVVRRADVAGYPGMGFWEFIMFPEAAWTDPNVDVYFTHDNGGYGSVCLIIFSMPNFRALGWDV